MTFNDAEASGRTRLSLLNEETIAVMTWLENALAPEWTLADFEAARSGSQGILVSDADGVGIGLALLRPDYPAAGDATITLLAVDPARRFRGLGGEAGLAVEAMAREQLGAQRVYVGVPEGRGLAVYFWLRLGFRPMGLGEAPEVPLGLTSESKPGIWMLRDTA